MSATDLIANAVKEAMARKAEWLEDVIAGLMINGIDRADIEISECQDFRGTTFDTIVRVRGVPKYHHTISYQP